MQILRNRSFLSFWCKASVWMLALVWCIGLLAGCIFAAATGPSVYSLMHAASQCGVSIIGLLTVFTLPFLLTALAVYFHQPNLLLLIAFIKAFIWSFSGMLIFLSFGSGGWLVRFLLLFSDFGIIPVLYWAWVRCISGTSFNKTELVCSGIWLMAFAIIDYCIVSPYLVLLID